MHAKHRNAPGNGYRGNAMGVSSIAGSSRSSYEGPIRGHRMYNPEYRNYNRGGYGRGGHSKHFQHQIQPPREADIIMEAGRLAAEYLVSKELLSPAALSGKYSDALDNQFGNFEIRPQKLEVSDGRVSVHSRLGNSLSSFGQGRRRYPDEYISLGSRSSMKGRKKAESMKINAADFNRNFKRTGSLNSNRTSSYIEGDANASNGHDEEQTAAEDLNSGVQNSSLVEANREADFGKKLDNADAKHSSSSNEVSKASDVEGLVMKELHDVDKVGDNKEASGRLDDDMHQKCHENEEIKDMHQKCDEVEKVRAFSGETGVANKDPVDLLKHCKFINLPTRPRSSLTIKGSRSTRNSTNDEKDNSRIERLEGSSVHVMDVDTGSSVCNDSSGQKNEFKALQLHVTDSPSVENNVSLHSTKIPGESSKSVSREQEIDDSVSSFGTSTSVQIESGKKRSVDGDVDDIEDTKKFRPWVLPVEIQYDCMSQVSTSLDNQAMVQAPGTSQHALSIPSYDESCLAISLSPKVHSGIQVMEEKDLFPSSFKTCDLNLSGSHEADSLPVFPSTKQAEKVSLPIDIDLSISNTCNLAASNGKNVVSENSIEILDLEKGSAMEIQTFGNPDRRGEALFTGFDGLFSNANVISDVHDGFGLMISEFLGNQSPSCSSVPTDLTSLHNQMILPNHEGILADDDSIYMSLGEIPISFLGPWEPPAPDYGKPF